MSDNVIQFRKRKKPKPTKALKRQRQTPSSPIALIAVVGVSAALAAVYTDFPATGSPVQAVSFNRCGFFKRNCVIDGDTLYVGSEKVRVADIDTPEVSEPKCASEKALGEQATERFIELINAGRLRNAGAAGARRRPVRQEIARACSRRSQPRRRAGVRRTREDVVGPERAVVLIIA